MRGRLGTDICSRLVVGCVVASALLNAHCALEAGIARERIGVDAGRSDDAGLPPPKAVDFCSQLPLLASGPRIDGTVEPGLLPREVPRDTWRGKSDPIPNDVSARFAAAWTPSGLYLFAHVSDATRAPSPLPDAAWCGDTVHFFVDSDGVYADPPAYDRIGTRELLVPAPTNGQDTATQGYIAVGGPLAPWTGQFASFPVSDGYVVEALVQAEALGLGSWPLAANAQVGVSLSISVSGVRTTPDPDDGTCEGLRLGDFGLIVDRAAACETPHCNVDTFCNPTLTVD